MKIFKLTMAMFVLLVMSGCASMGSISVNDCFVGGGTVNTDTNECEFSDGSSKPVE